MDLQALTNGDLARQYGEALDERDTAAGALRDAQERVDALHAETVARATGRRPTAARTSRSGGRSRGGRSRATSTPDSSVQDRAREHTTALLNGAETAAA